MYDASVGASNYGYPGYGGYPAAVYPSYAPLAYPTGYDIVGNQFPGYDVVGANGATPAPAPAQPGFVDRAKEFLQKESIGGIKNQNLLLGAAALGGIYYGWTAGWFGGRPKKARR